MKVYSIPEFLVGNFGREINQEFLQGLTCLLNITAFYLLFVAPDRI
jgi:hypothetical protein